jgi:hypothetical protein
MNKEDLLEASYCYTLTDAIELINHFGFNSFVNDLFKAKSNRNLTIEEMEAMDKLHDGWNL